MTRKMKKLAEKSEKIAARSGPAPTGQKESADEQASATRSARTSPGRLMEFSAIQQQREAEHQIQLTEKEQQIEELKEQLDSARVFSRTAEDRELGALLKVPVGQLVPSPYQPRIFFNEDEMNELIESIRMNGIREALLVRQSKDHPGKFEIISGHRRHHAATVIGIEEVRVIVNEMSDRDAHINVLLSNEVRANPSFFERALSYRDTLDRGYFKSQNEIAKAFGVSRPYITYALSLLEIPSVLIELIRTRPHLIGMRTAIEITRLARDYPSQADIDILEEAIRRIVVDGKEESGLKSWFMQKRSAIKNRRNLTPVKSVVNERNEEVFLVKPPNRNRIEILIKDKNISGEEVQDALVRFLQSQARPGAD